MFRSFEPGAQCTDRTDIRPQTRPFDPSQTAWLFFYFKEVTRRFRTNHQECKDRIRKCPQSGISVTNLNQGKNVTKGNISE